MQNKIKFKIINYGSHEYNSFVALRQSVLRDPLKMKYSTEDLLKDNDGVLLGAYISDQIVATAILKINDNQCKVCQVATHSNLQKSGIGSLMMKEVERIAKNLNCTLCYCSARISAKEFYLKNNYIAIGEEFEEIGLPHIKMIKYI